jgi:hypothetical protein
MRSIDRGCPVEVIRTAPRSCRQHQREGVVGLDLAGRAASSLMVFPAFQPMKDGRLLGLLGKP